MNDFKDKLYHYEAQPPEELWDNITEELDKGQRVLSKHNRTRSKILFYSLTAAASLVIIFTGSLFFKKNKQPYQSNVASNISPANLPAEKINDSIILNQKILKSIINSPEEKKEILSDPPTLDKKYLTITGPQGKPVKISPKVATLILSANNEYPPKPVWSRKIEKWKKIMLNSSASTTSANIIDFLITNDNIE